MQGIGKISLYSVILAITYRKGVVRFEINQYLNSSPDHALYRESVKSGQPPTPASQVVLFEEDCRKFFPTDPYGISKALNTTDHTKLLVDAEYM